MKVSTILIVVFIFLASFTGNHLPSIAPPAEDPTPYLRTIVIDPGHGGRDHGSKGDLSKEKDIALSVAFKLGATIQANHPNIKLVYTRHYDEFITLKKRAEIANENNGDLFISIHCNAVRDHPEIKGIETYVLGIDGEISNLAKRENEVIYLEDEFESSYGVDPNTVQGRIKFGMYQNAFLDQSITLAGHIQRQVADYTGRKVRHVKQDKFVVLRLSNMPSVLVEMGFVSNKEEEEYLLSLEGQDQMAMSLYLAFRDYKNELEGFPAGY